MLPNLGVTTVSPCHKNGQKLKSSTADEYAFTKHQRFCNTGINVLRKRKLAFEQFILKTP